MGVIGIKSISIKMTRLLLLLSALSLYGCTHWHSDDPNSLSFTLPEGSLVSLNQPLTIPEGYTHTVIQFGKETDDYDKKDYEINCRVDFREFGPRTIAPEKFTIERTEDGSNWISRPSILRFYTEIYLSSQQSTDIIKIVCQQYGDSIDRNFTVSEMQQTLADIITFDYLQNQAKNE